MPLDDLERGLVELADAEPDYLNAELYYKGQNPEHFASARMYRALRAYESRFRIRLAKVPVDAVANRLEVATVTVNRLGAGSEDEGGEPVGEQDAALTQQLQDEVREANDMEVDESEIMHSACMYGDAYLIVDHDAETNEVTLYYNNPYECRIFYDRSGRHKQFAIKVWYDIDQDDQEFGRATLFYTDAVEEYVTKPGADGNNIVDWMPLGPGSEMSPDVVEDGGPPPTPTPGVYFGDFGQIPVFHFRTKKPYGMPEHEAAYGPQDMIDKLTITQMATVDFQGFPQRYFLEDPSFESGSGEDWGEGDSDPDTESAPTPKLKAGPGEVWFMEGMKAAGQFDPASAQAFLQPLDKYAKAMAVVTETPIHLWEGQAPSGDSRRSAEAGQTKKIRQRQKQFGATWREVYAYAMSLLTGQSFEDLRDRIEIRWVPAESLDQAEAWDLASKKKAVGLPLTQILAEHGYSADDIKAFMKLALEERKLVIELQRETFQASMQERREDRPNRPNPDVPQQPEREDVSTT